MIVKRAVTKKTRMGLRICEVDKDGTAKVTNAHKARPFGKLKGLVFLVR